MDKQYRDCINFFIYDAWLSRELSFFSHLAILLKLPHVLTTARIVVRLRDKATITASDNSQSEWVVTTTNYAKILSQEKKAHTQHLNNSLQHMPIVSNNSLVSACTAIRSVCFFFSFTLFEFAIFRFFSINK